MLKKHFITGLVILLPLTVTIFVVFFIVNFLTKPFMGWVINILSSTRLKDFGFYIFSSEQVIRYGSQIIILLGLFILTLFLGVLGRWFLFNTIIKWSDHLLQKIPLVNKVYKTSQEIIKTLFISDKNSFKQVVLAPFPSTKTYSLGLVSRQSPQTCKTATNSNDLLSVFIPTTPNPTTGFLLMYKKEDLIFLTMKTEDAIKYIVSCGVITPEYPQTNESKV